MSVPTAAADVLLTPAETARLLRVSTRTLWKWEAAGTMPPAVRRSTRKVYWRRAEVEAFIAAGLRWTPEGGAA
jgi:predicted DNA-binding transcriptional regulator AlpA